MILTHRIALDPTFATRIFARAAGRHLRVELGAPEWERQYQAGAAPSGVTLKVEFNRIKYEQFPWLRDIHRDANSQPFANLQKAWVTYFKGEAGRPRFKSKKVSKDSFYVANDKLALDGFHVRLPVIGWVRCAKNFASAARSWGLSLAEVLGAGSSPSGLTSASTTAKGTAMAWSASIWASSSLATLSSGEVVENPRPLRRLLRATPAARPGAQPKTTGVRQPGKVAAAAGPMP